MVDENALRDEDEALAYPFAIPRLRRRGLPYIEPLAMWQALLGDLVLRTPVADDRRPLPSAGSRRSIATMVRQARAPRAPGRARRSTRSRCPAAASRTGVLLEEIERRLARQGFTVLHARAACPANDGGLALGQAAIAAAARCIARRSDRRNRSCVSAFPAGSSRSPMPERKLGHGRCERRAAPGQHRLHRRRRPPARVLRRRLGAGARRLRHEPDRRGGGRGDARDADRARRSAGRARRDAGIGDVARLPERLLASRTP